MCHIARKNEQFQMTRVEGLQRHESLQFLNHGIHGRKACHRVFVRLVATHKLVVLEQCDFKLIVVERRGN